MRNFISCCFFLVAFFSCTELEDVVRPYPRIRTLEIVKLNNNSIHARGEITSTQEPIIDHGFIWSTKKDSPVNIFKHFKLSLGAADDIGIFEADLEGLTSGVKYYVKAYAKSDTYTVYGEILEITL